MSVKRAASLRGRTGRPRKSCGPVRLSIEKAAATTPWPSRVRIGVVTTAARGTWRGRGRWPRRLPRTSRRARRRRPEWYGPAPPAPGLDCRDRGHVVPEVGGHQAPGFKTLDRDRVCFHGKPPFIGPGRGTGTCRKAQSSGSALRAPPIRAGPHWRVRHGAGGGRAARNGPRGDVCRGPCGRSTQCPKAGRGSCAGGNSSEGRRGHGGAGRPAPGSGGTGVRRTVQSSWAVRNCVPSGDRSAQTTCEVKGIRRTSAPVPRSQTRTVLSNEEDKACRPPGRKASPWIQPVWPVNRRISRPFSASHRMISVRAPSSAERTCRPSAEKHTRNAQGVSDELADFREATSQRRTTLS